MTTNEQTPIWISVKEVQYYFSIGKTRCYELIKDKAITTKVDRKRGAKQGKRLINFESVEAYITSLPDEADGLILQSSPLTTQGVSRPTTTNRDLPTAFNGFTIVE